jgi:uncharacterized membrane protein
MSTSSVSFAQYLTNLSENYWFYSSLGIILGTLVCSYLLPPQSPYVTLRGVVGSLFTLFVPGYSLVKALFIADRELTEIAVYPLSVVVSIVITYVMGLIINSMIWSLDRDYIILSLAVVTLVSAIIGVYRRFHVFTEEPPSSERKGG